MPETFPLFAYRLPLLSFDLINSTKKTVVGETTASNEKAAGSLMRSAHGLELKGAHLTGQTA
jgi:hypothetical protein